MLSDRVVVLSPRPAEVVADIAIDLPRPRAPEDARTADFCRPCRCRLRRAVAGRRAARPATGRAMSDAATFAAPPRGTHGRETALGLILVLLGWELAARALTGAFVLAAPSEVLGWLAANSGLMTRALAETLGNAAAGFVLGNLAAVALAGIALAFPATQRLVTGVALVVFCLPLVATGPILRVIFGPGDGPQIALAALAVYYTTLIPLLVGLRAAPATWFDLVASYGRGRVAALIHVRLMASLPYLFRGAPDRRPRGLPGRDGGRVHRRRARHGWC